MASSDLRWRYSTQFLCEKNQNIGQCILIDHIGTHYKASKPNNIRQYEYAPAHKTKASQLWLKNNVQKLISKGD